jgi:Fur family ferric uptake transcriptional regulator
MPGKKSQEEKALFHRYLRQNGLKKTHQKDLILETFLANEGHLSVEDIYSLVKQKDKKVGIVTVFRTLKSLTACGIAKEITLGDGLTRFEHCYDHPVHHHIICTQCQTVIEFLSPELEAVQQNIVARYEFEPMQQRIQIYGTCRNCRERLKAPATPKADTGKIFARDALRVALAMQTQGVEFYRSAAALNRDPAGREVFESRAKEEEAHAQILMAELEGMYRSQRGLEEAPVFLHFDPEELRQLLPGMQEEKTGEGMHLDARRALELAMQLEKRAARFFEDYADKFADTEGKRILQRLADEERKHYNSISRQVQLMLSASSGN